MPSFPEQWNFTRVCLSLDLFSFILLSTWWITFNQRIWFFWSEKVYSIIVSFVSIIKILDLLKLYLLSFYISLILTIFLQKVWRIFSTLSSYSLIWNGSVFFLLFRHFTKFLKFWQSYFNFWEFFLHLFHSSMALFHQCENLWIVLNISTSSQVTCCLPWSLSFIMLISLRSQGVLKLTIYIYQWRTL